MELEKKIIQAKKIIEQAIKKYPRIGAGCSFGKDSLVAAHLARSVKPDLSIFSIMTIYKPAETFAYLMKINRLLNFDTRVYIVSQSAPAILKKGKIIINLLPPDKFLKSNQQAKEKNNKELHGVNPDECCRLLKVAAIEEATKGFDAWFSGLRRNEGVSRKTADVFEARGNLVKVNPLLDFTADDVFNYLAKNNIPVHPWYEKESADGRRYRSLGCAPCTQPIFNWQAERDGRWSGVKKCGGECGINTYNFINN